MTELETLLLNRLSELSAQQAQHSQALLQLVEQQSRALQHSASQLAALSEQVEQLSAQVEQLSAQVEAEP